MSKANKMYKIFMTTMIVAIAGMLLAMGIIAAQRTMKVNVAFPANPYYKIEIWIQKSGDEEKLAFCNFEDEDLDKEIVMQNGITSLNGSTITADNSFFTAYENEFYIIIKNYTESTGIEVSMSSTAKVDENTEGIPAQFDPIKTTASKFDRNNPTDVDYIKYNVFANAVFPQQTTLQIEIDELSGFTITLNYNDDDAGDNDTTVVLEGVTTLPDVIQIPTRTGHTFAGWYDDVIIPTNKPNGETQYYSYDYLTGGSSATLNNGIATAISADKTLHARWLPFTINTYDANHVWAGYKYITFANKSEGAFTNYDGTTTQTLPLNWIIIGAGESVNGKVFSGASRPATVDTTKENNELGDNELLLLSEYVLFNQYFSEGGNSSLWSASTIKTLLNEGFMTDSGLNNYTNYIPTKSIYTSSGNDGDCTTDDKIFLLAPSETGENQTFCVQTYLGTDDTVTKYTSFEGADYWWLRAGDSAHIEAMGYSFIYVYYVQKGSGLRFSTGGLYGHMAGVRPSFVLNLA